MGMLLVLSRGFAAISHFEAGRFFFGAVSRDDSVGPLSLVPATALEEVAARIVAVQGPPGCGGPREEQ